MINSKFKVYNVTFSMKMIFKVYTLNIKFIWYRATNSEDSLAHGASWSIYLSTTITFLDKMQIILKSSKIEDFSSL